MLVVILVDGEPESENVPQDEKVGELTSEDELVPHDVCEREVTDVYDEEMLSLSEALETPLALALDRVEMVGVTLGASPFSSLLGVTI